MPKKLKGDPLVSPGIVCYVEKEEKPFWFRSLGQMIGPCDLFPPQTTAGGNNTVGSNTSFKRNYYVDITF